MGSTSLQRSPTLRGPLPPVIVVAWLWIGLVAVLLSYLLIMLFVPAMSASQEGGQEVRGLFWGPTPLGLPLRHLIKIINVLFALLLWLQWSSSRARRQGRRLIESLLYLGTALLLLMLEWGCHVVGESLRS